MLTPGSVLGCTWARAIRLTRMPIHIHMLTRILATITAPIILPTGTATVIQRMDIGAVDFGAAIVTAMTGDVDFEAASVDSVAGSVDSTVVVDFVAAVDTDAAGKSIR
jgi:hypothetical protein